MRDRERQKEKDRQTNRKNENIPYNVDVDMLWVINTHGVNLTKQDAILVLIADYCSNR